MSCELTKTAVIHMGVANGTRLQARHHKSDHFSCQDQRVGGDSDDKRRQADSGSGPFHAAAARAESAKQRGGHSTNPRQKQ